MPFGPDPYLKSIENDLTALRHDLHQIPEIGLDLPQTQARILAELQGLPLEITLGKKLSSITAVLRGKAASAGERPAVLLRADMDALPVDEQTGLDWASTNGSMHACGHDCHMTGLVGAAKALSRRVDELAGDVVFMFQPGEEHAGGARLMIEEGVLDAAGRRVDAAYGLHVWSGLDKAGVFYCRPGTIMASSNNLDIEFTGKGGHGSAPHLAKDPVPALADAITALQVMVTRNFDIFDPVVITCGHVFSGVVRNIIPETASIEATMRTFSDASQRKLFDLVPDVIDHVARAHGVTAAVKVDELYPTTVNAPDNAALVAQTVTDVLGAEHFHALENPMAAAEDFSYVLQNVPGAFAILAATPIGRDPLKAYGNHSAFAAYDDCVLPQAAAVLEELAVRTINRAD